VAEGLGEGIRTRRRRKGWTLQDLSVATTLSIPYLSDLERRDGMNPTLETLESISGALGCSVADLIGASSAQPDSPPPSLARLVRSEEFRHEIKLIAQRTNTSEDETERQLLNFLVVAPRRSTGDLQPADWRRLLDVFRMITDER
jgi:transcriptional regulator with XRE-family HTH domain